MTALASDKKVRAFRHRVWVVGAVVALASGCSLLPSDGPSSGQVAGGNESYRGTPIPVVDLTAEVAQRAAAEAGRDGFAQAFAGDHRPAYVLGPGDMVQVSVWEAPPSILFGMAAPGQNISSSTSGAGMTPTTSTPATFPEQMVAADGTINVPFVGAVQAAGNSPQQVEQAIQQSLKGMANQPQVMVQVVRNATSVVTVVGEVNQSLNMPLTARGERVLDALAAAGGAKQPVSKTSIELVRGNVVHTMPLEAIIRDPKQNVILQPGDVVTVLFQPNSFTALGAVGKNDEVPFEAQGITLAQALGRIGGLQDDKANPQGAFIFRFEDKSFAQAITQRKDLPTTPDGRVPVVYRVDLKDPATFLLAQSFPVRDKDVIYVANAPLAELQKFLNILVSAVMPVGTLKTVGAYH